MKRLHTYAAVAAITGTLVLTGCDDLDHGEITGKEYEAEATYTYLQPITTVQCSGSGTSQMCATNVVGYIPITTTDPECWRLNLRDGDKTGHVCVSKSAWKKAKKGEQW
ncbi:hypothetical protein [Streptomyces sp. NPDC002088]|uniref:hypothetical protein n=1 Tax=Streptomyces sp. NPDC002088 TaxID=3154665 RepID=UPI003317E8BF